MERFLDAYIGRIRPYFPGFSPDTAHGIASAFLAFKFGLYAKAVRECTTTLARMPDGEANAAMKKALEIIRSNAQDRENSVVNTSSVFTFTDAELKFVPVNIPPGNIEDTNTFSLDNALVFVYCVALITSSDDEETLGEHRTLIVRMLADYKKALGLE